MQRMCSQQKAPFLPKCPESLRLPQLKFYGVLGNHDYGRSNAMYNHSIVPQLEYTAYDPQQRWYIPTRYWAEEAKGPGDKQLKIKIYITAVDS